jgi:hypothetical protein
VYQKWIGSVEALCGEYADLRGMSFESYPLFSCFRAREIRAGLFAAAGILL